VSGSSNAISAVDDVKEKVSNGVWAIRDGSAFSNSCNQHFGFLRSSENFLQPLLGNSQGCVNKTVDYLKSHKDRKLNITGYYNNQETNSTPFENLGLGRANKVKSYLQSLGIPASQLGIEGKLSKTNWWRSDTLSRGIDFGFAGLGDSSGRINDIKSRLVGKPLTLYFGTNQDNVNLTSQQRKDIADIMYYLDNVSSAKLDIGGHTDNVGNRAYNVNLSQERADFVRTYLRTNGGIPAAKMNTRGYGPDTPIADNSTNEGKAKNRRVEVILR